MVEFLKVQYRLGRVTEKQIDMLVTQMKITEDDKVYIMGL